MTDRSYRYGCDYGTIAGIPNTQHTILQTDIGFLVDHVYCASEQDLDGPRPYVI